MRGPRLASAEDRVDDRRSRRIATALGIAAALCLLAFVWSRTADDRGAAPTVVPVDDAGRSNSATAVDLDPDPDPRPDSRVAVSAARPDANFATGRIVDALTGAPIRAAHVVDLLVPAQFAVTTDADGRFDIRAVDLERCIVAADHYLPRSSLDGATWSWTRHDESTLQLELDPDDLTLLRSFSFFDSADSAAGEVEFWLESTARGSVRGHLSDRTSWRSYRRLWPILDAARDGAEDARLAPLWFGESPLVRGLRSGPDGRASLRFGVVGAVRVLGRDARGRTFVGEFEVTPELRAATFSVRERRSASVSGLVVDRSTSTPIAGATVSSDLRAMPLHTLTLADGSFEFGPLLETASLTIVAFGYERCRVADVSAPRDGMRIELTPTPRRALTIAVHAPLAERPLVGAIVECLDRDRRVAVASTDANGRAILQVPDEPVRIRIAAPGHLSTDVIVPPQVRELRRTLVPDSLDERLACGLAARIRGRVLGSSGIAIEGLRLRIDMLVDRAPSLVQATNPFDALDRRDVKTVAVTDAAGSFEFECTRAGRFRIVPLFDDVAPREVDIALGESHDLGPLVVPTR